MGTLDWGENPCDAVMVDVAKGMGYEMVGTTTPYDKRHSYGGRHYHCIQIPSP